MEKSASFVTVIKALAEFQGKMASLKKTADNPYYKSKYCPLPVIQDAIKQPLLDCGLWYSQLPDGKDLVTLLVHLESGEYIESRYEMTAASSSPQAIGSAITYAKRYGLVAILALEIDEDDDGNAASVKEQPKEQQKNNQLVSPEILDQWKAVIKGCKTTDDLLALYNREKVKIDSAPEIKACFTQWKNYLKKQEVANAKQST